MKRSSDRPVTDDRGASVRRHIAPAILLKVRIFLVVFVLVTVAAMVGAFRGTDWTWVFVLTGLAVGVLLGALASQMQQFSWDEFETRIVGKFDAIGVVILIAYVVFSIFRARIVGAWIPAMHVSATSLAVLAGVMLGQVLGIRRGLRELAVRMRRSGVGPS